VGEGIPGCTLVKDMLSEIVIFVIREVSGIQFEFHDCCCSQVFWEGSEQQFNLGVLGPGFLVDQNAADILVG
jgi:hypothetical protein